MFSYNFWTKSLQIQRRKKINYLSYNICIFQIPKHAAPRYCSVVRLVLIGYNRSGGVLDASECRGDCCYWIMEFTMATFAVQRIWYGRDFYNNIIVLDCRSISCAYVKGLWMHYWSTAAVVCRSKQPVRVWQFGRTSAWNDDPYRSA